MAPTFLRCGNVSILPHSWRVLSAVVALLKWVTRRGDNWTLATLAISPHSSLFCAVIKWHGCATNKRDNGRGLSQSVRWNNSSHPPSPVMCRAAPCIPWINYHRPLKTSPAKLFSQQILLELNWEIPIVGRTKKYISVNSQVSLRQKCGKSCFWIEQIQHRVLFLLKWQVVRMADRPLFSARAYRVHSVVSSTNVLFLVFPQTIIDACSDPANQKTKYNYLVRSALQCVSTCTFQWKNLPKIIFWWLKFLCGENLIWGQKIIRYGCCALNSS